MLFKRKTKTYDKEKYTPALRSSICTGERVVGFTDKKTGQFKDIKLIKSEKDLNDFLKEYNIKKEQLKQCF